MTLPTVPAPRADVKVGFACNNRCVFCAQGEKRTQCKAIPFEVLVERLQEARKKADALVLTGGEPTMHRHLPQLVRRARDMGFRVVQIQTNGRLLSYPHMLQGLIAAGATEFSPSLHGSTAELHDGLTRAPGSWQQSMKGIRAVAAAGKRLITNSVITQSNVHDLPNLVGLLGSLGVRQAQLAFVHPVGTALERFDEVVPRLPEVARVLFEARAVALDHQMLLATEAIPFCFLRGLEELCVEVRIPQTTVLDLDGAPGDYSRWRTAEGKSHGAPCEVCVERTRCEGPWREYPERHGWEEFKPVTNALQA
jgi:MoaA/NifB/PqqE/SkfB family radical SAM enzyme